MSDSLLGLVEPVDACRHCGCTAETPCRVYGNDECMWLTTARDLCTNPRCLRAEAALLRKRARARRQEIAAAVQPIAERWVQGRRRAAEALRNKRKRMTRRNRRAA